MNGEPENPVEDLRPLVVRFSLGQLLFWPFFLAPLFLMPVAMRGSSGVHPLVQLASAVVAPVAYVSVLVWLRWRRDVAAAGARRSFVFVCIGRGVAYALLMALMTYGWLLYQPLRRLVELAWEGWLSAAWRELVWVPLWPAALVGVFYTMMGAATGGIVGLVLDRASRPYASAAPPADQDE